MKYNKAMDKLPRVVQILIAVIPFLHILHVIYAIIEDNHNKNGIGVLVDVLLGIIPFPFVFWVANIFTVIFQKKVFTFGTHIKD